MKLVSWNVNGLRACLDKGFAKSVGNLRADVICIQETKMAEGPEGGLLPEYAEYWHGGTRKGYSGTAVFTRPLPGSRGPEFATDSRDKEGRVLALEYAAFTLVSVYTPNSQQELKRLDYRMQWDDDFRAYLKKLDKKKPLIVCGDLNVAHQEIDIRNVKSNRRNAGFTDEERAKMTELLSAGFVDTFRALHPDTGDAYTFWSFRGNARANNVGWRVDYFLVSKRLMPKVTGAAIHPSITGSDHCPIELDIDLV